MGVAQVATTILAFDYGEKRIGVAVKTGDRSKPVALTTLDAKTNLWSQVSHLVSKYEPELIVVGWPRGLDGQHTKQTSIAEDFASELKMRYGKEVVMQDEVLTSEEAQKRLDPRLTIRKQRELIDAVAAQIILEDYLG